MMNNGQKEYLLLTGVTGTLGKDLIAEILSTTAHHLFLLVRDKRSLGAEARVMKILADKGLKDCLSRITVLDGDITQPGFGLPHVQVNEMLRKVDRFFHVAALTALNGSRDDCFRINLEGTGHALQLAMQLRKEGRLQRFYYFSTAYVAGSRQTFCAPEDSLPEKPAHANHYEASKYQAEKKVRAALAEGLPVTIFRPSIVVGDSRTGAVSEFNVIYPFMRLFAHGMIRKLPTRLENTFNIVPIDYVIKAALATAGQPSSVGKTYHLVTDCPPSIGDLLEVGREEYAQLPEIEIINPDSFSREDLSINEKFIYDMMEPYLGYLNDHLTFETANTTRALQGTGITAPRTDREFLRRLVRYAINAGYLMAASET